MIFSFSQLSYQFAANEPQSGFFCKDTFLRYKINPGAILTAKIVLFLLKVSISSSRSKFAKESAENKYVRQKLVLQKSLGIAELLAPLT